MGVKQAIELYFAYLGKAWGYRKLLKNRHENTPDCDHRNRGYHTTSVCGQSTNRRYKVDCRNHIDPSQPSSQSLENPDVSVQMR